MPTNCVLITTDMQTTSMVEAYTDAAVDTPNLDRLAENGLRFDRAYATCPVCTPSRGSIFSGLHPQRHGAWANNLTPHADVSLMGTIFRDQDCRAAYTGKWHLDGAGYFGSGEPDGGFEADWWYDGRRYADEVGEGFFRHYRDRSVRTPGDLREAGFTEENVWGHRVADRAIDFLESIDDEPFVLSVSFEEPHAPFVAPPEYWEHFSPDDLPKPDTFAAPIDDKPAIQQVAREEGDVADWGSFADPEPDAVLGDQAETRRFGCNSYVDREIGRVLEAVDQMHGEDTLVIYTSDHGTMMGAHGQRVKGPMMYDEITNVPFIVSGPGVPTGESTDALASHVDILPTMLDVAELDVPERLHGTSLRPVLENDEPVRETAIMNWHRFGVGHDAFGEFYPIRCITDGRHKLSINLFETDEFYDLKVDPGETTNRIDDPEYASIRGTLHERLLERMDEINDPFRTFRWGDRPWNSIREPFYYGGL